MYCDPAAADNATRDACASVIAATAQAIAMVPRPTVTAAVDGVSTWFPIFNETHFQVCDGMRPVLVCVRLTYAAQQRSACVSKMLHACSFCVSQAFVNALLWWAA